MTANPLCRADLHLHTCPSFCAPKDMRAASYLPLRAAERIGLCEDDLWSVVRTAPVR